MCSSILVTQDWSIFYGFAFNKDYSTQTYICAHLHFTLNICCLTLILTVWLQTFCGTFIMSFYCLLPSSYCTSSLVSSLIYLTAAKAQRLSAVKAGSDTSPLKVKVKHQCGRRTLNLRFESASDSTGKVRLAFTSIPLPLRKRKRFTQQLEKKEASLSLRRGEASLF